MTLRIEGTLGKPPRSYGVRRAGESGPPEAFVCLGCEKETKPTAEAFSAHRCARRGSASTSSTTQESSE
jgi:hypothetical protein